MTGRTASLLAAATMTIAAMAACRETPPRGGATISSPPLMTAIGPVPGPPAPSPDTPNPYAGDSAAAVEGRQLFVRFNCSGCHGGRAGGGMGPSLRDVDWLYGNRDAQLYSSIAEGRAHGMPSWQPRLTADQIWKLVAYIKALRTSSEPQAPTW